LNIPSASDFYRYRFHGDGNRILVIGSPNETMIISLKPNQQITQATPHGLLRGTNYLA
jgi:hypothetical protein